MNSKTKEQIRSITNTSAEDISVAIQNKWQDVSPLIFNCNWMQNNARVITQGNPNFYIVGQGGITPSPLDTVGKGIKSFTMGCKVPVSNTILNNHDRAEQSVVNSLAIGTASAIEYGLFFGNGEVDTPTITSTSTVVTTGGINNLVELRDMYNKFNPSMLDGGAIWIMGKEARDSVLNYFAENPVTFEQVGQRPYFMGVPIYFSENFTTENGVLAALINPQSMFMRCSILEEGILKLSEIKAHMGVTEFLSVFDVGGLVDDPRNSIVLKVQAAPVASTTRTTKKK